MNNTAPVERVARRILRELRALRNPARVRVAQQYFKHEVASLGIDTPTLRRYGRDQVGRLKAMWSLNEALQLCDRLLREPELEIRGIGFLVLGGFQGEFTPRMLTTAKRWLRTRLDNWALVDGFCGAVLSPLLERHPSVEHTLRTWSADDCLWVRRACLVTLVPFARRGRSLDLTYRLAANHWVDEEDLMHKATGWLLREAGKTDMPRLKSFLLKHGPRIPRTTLRYAIERFPAEERRWLLETTHARSQPRRMNAPDARITTP